MRGENDEKKSDSREKEKKHARKKETQW